MSRQPKWSSFSGFLKSSSENVTRTRQERKKPVTKSSKKSNATKTKRLSSDRLGFTPVITPIHSPPYSQDDFKRDEEADERPANRPSPRSPTSPSSNKDRYEITDYIGGGSYGCVFSAIDTKDGHEVAVKTQSNFSKRKKNVVMLLREVRCLRLLRGHPCVVELYDVMVPDDLATFDELSFVFEKADTTLRSVLKSDQFFAPVHVQTIMYQILCGLKFIHSASIVHRDIKPENILINTNVTVKICDLGMARGIEELMPNLEDRVSMSSRPSVSDVTPTLTTPTTPLLTPSSYATPSHHRNLSTSSLSSASRTPGGRSPWKRTPRSITRHVVTRWYRPPEVLLFDQQMGEVLKAIDIWSAGCVMGELLQMLPENCGDYRERAAIFPGSGSTLSAEAFQPDDSADGDQLKQIFAILGSPTRSDQAAIQSDKALRIISFLGETEGTGLDRMFPGSSGASMSLMKSLLRINPYDRMTANDAVQLQYFDPIRKSLGSRDEYEQRTLPAMGFEFERPMAEIRMSELREKLVDEIAYFHREIKEHWTPPENSAHRYEGRRRRRFSVGRKSDLI